MFEYLDREGLSRHDGLHAFNDVIKLCENSGSDPKIFYQNILKQVHKDSGTYDEGTAHHHLNAIAAPYGRTGITRREERARDPETGEYSYRIVSNLKKSVSDQIEKVLNTARRYPSVRHLQALTESFERPQDVFASWNNLKRFSELEQLIQQSEILDQLQELKGKGKEKLYTFVETLAFHPTSKVNMQDVMQFWRNPAAFLNNQDSHTPAEVHDRKKPSNYTEIPNLDLTAEQLRDALVEGKIDQLQVFTPLAIRYEILKDNEKYPPTSEMIREALGSKKNNVEGKAKNSQKLFGELKKAFKQHGLDLQPYLGMTEEQYLPEPLNQQIRELCYNPVFGMAKPETTTFIAKINRKSDPNSVLAGNDTACCMPFGSGKNNVYMFNPDTSLFTLQIETSDGKLRTITQSVLTKDADIKKTIPEVIEQLKKQGEHLTEIIPEAILSEAPRYLAADNVEVAPNYRGEEYSQIIALIYRDFFKEYMNRYAKQQNLNPESVPVGKGYSDSLVHLPEKPNTFAPLAPVGYSDKTHPTVYELNLTGELPHVEKEILESAPLPATASVPVPEIRGVEYLDFQDTLATAYLEGKAYSDNESLVVYLHNIENGLIAKDINNTTKDRPNMSLKYVDDQGKMRGYLLAYEGKITDAGAGPLIGERALYISDLASDQQSRRAGGSLIKAFAALYKQNYLAKDNYLPLYVQARETTSYRIIQRQIEGISQDLGIEIELEELPTYQAGEDTMHPVIIRPRRKLDA